MRTTWTLAAALVLGAASGAAAQDGERMATCRGMLNGSELTTIIEFSNGHHVMGPWRILRVGDRLANGAAGVSMDASLDRVVERRPGAASDVTTPFPRPIETRFEGATETEVVARAAQIWCATVMKVQNGSGRPVAPPPDGGSDRERGGERPAPAAPDRPPGSKPGVRVVLDG